MTIMTIMSLVGGAMVASLLTGGSTPSPLRPPNSGLPNAVTTFEVGEMTLYVNRVSKLYVENQQQIFNHSEMFIIKKHE